MKVDSIYKEYGVVKEINLKKFDDTSKVTMALDKPLKILDSMEEWKAMDLWNEDYFLSLFSQEEILAKRYINGMKEIKKFSLQEYFIYLKDESDEIPFYLTDCQLHLGTSLEEDYQEPEVFSCWYKKIKQEERKSTLSWIYIAPKYSISPLHLDLWGTSAWNGVINGEKLWMFFSPDQYRYLYNGRVNPFNPDFSTYPLFDKARPEVCFQSKGEMVFTPSGWWHAVLNLERGFSITENFINNTNSTRVLEYFKNLSPPSYKTIQKLIENNS
ncbi:cupin-like domain-containing protein [Pedobacter sp. GR22-10]|uniref:cupin-like domain-containing protein n=1 Tax=Pedobacter sp. GR22-10 TaxID=2994472 RepID=UPI002245F0EB|nr:cupin-like domain-containing protein [Pedobacter sp. GR22-10]MCX2431623.1 cupin-like domain-containing protein [Pedobacter sp. GR22-10]